MTALYLYPGWLRLWHWINAVLFVVLIASGVSLHYAGAAELLPFDVARIVHNVAGILLTLTWIGFVAGNLVTSNGRHYRIRLRGLGRRTWDQTFYYLVGIFRGDPHPFQVTETMKLNPLQQLSYVAAMFLLMPLLILSGWGFLLSVRLPETLFGLGTIWIVAGIHVVVSYLLVLFVLVHLYVITTGARVTTNLRAMLTGWHREDDDR
ncbi:thiosulfate reductase cytochrome B subunit (membrane anchoring protein) [Thioflavicoccus mobilis 8321]|uniref:Thiosulfate reductase cytochrome B subunit (Membrane anchoring protein) n=1 Tax=Thioflavicoccus mobilis 8321 TaxID=765912 RepID=L0GZ32_9GAMM|nr:cytochrome b/b6 domain-containing protein [Thioflavicoccus mobilis]AGA90640.1 thiosulfate reductase cytochrome B subunit (membrane anchoring protein) [Thioflavicoccus mobilis 8321]